jgi:hypothetical protein
MSFGGAVFTPTAQTSFGLTVRLKLWSDAAVATADVNKSDDDDDDDNDNDGDETAAAAAPTTTTAAGGSVSDTVCVTVSMPTTAITVPVKSVTTRTPAEAVKRVTPSISPVNVVALEERVYVWSPSTCVHVDTTPPSEIPDHNSAPSSPPPSEGGAAPPPWGRGTIPARSAVSSVNASIIGPYLRG